MQVTIISGASRGIGKAIAEDLKTLDGALIKLSSKNVDFEDYQAVYDGVISLLDCFDNITQINLVLCAAQIGIANDITLRDIDRLYKINVLGNMAVIEAARNYNCKMRIVWFSGGGAAFPYPEFFGYALSKVAVVRAVENYSIILKDCSIIALAPGAVDTDMLKIVQESGCNIRTRTDISEPVKFVRKFITGIYSTYWMNGRFIHVRDILNPVNSDVKDLFKLRRIE